VPPDTAALPRWLLKRQRGPVRGLPRYAHDVNVPARNGPGFRIDLAKAAHQAGMGIGLGDEQLDIDDLGRMDDRPRQAAAQSPGRIYRREAANVGPRTVGDVMLEGGIVASDRGGMPAKAAVSWSTARLTYSELAASHRPRTAPRDPIP